MVIDNPVRSAFSDDVERSPHAARVGRSRWLNPQVIVGIVLVLGSTAVGARLFAAADDTVPVLAAVTDLRPGQSLTPEAVEVRHVQLDDALDHYHAGDVGSGYVVVRPVDRGELLPASAVTAADDPGAADVRYLSLSLPSHEVPRALATGSSVDVWLTPPDDASRRTASAVAVGVTVAAADTGAGALGVEGSNTSVTLAITPGQGGAPAAEEDPDADDSEDGADDSEDGADDSEDGADGAGESSPDASAESVDDLVATLVGAARDGRVYLVLRPGTGTAP